VLVCERRRFGPVGGASLIGADLTGASLIGANLSRADLSDEYPPRLS
jgi:uncharacterized protein YjbI with pentapeptide repeats